jgi:hypothetical protein
VNMPFENNIINMKKLILTIVILQFFTSAIDAQSKREKKEIIRVYHIALNSSFNKEPHYFAMIDSTRNEGIRQFGFEDLWKSMHVNKDSTLSLSWISFLSIIKYADKSFERKKVPRLNTIHTIRILSEDSVRIFFEGNFQKDLGLVDKYGWAEGWIEISNVFFNDKRDKAVVEISHTRDPRDAYGDIFFLERRPGGQWFVRYRYRAWVA